MGVCCCLQTCNSVVNILVMELVLGPSLMVISILLYAKVSPFIAYYKSAFCCLHIKYIVYKYFDRSLHVWSSDLTCVQNFKFVPLTVFEIQGFKLKNENDDKKNWRNRHFAISLMLVVQF